MNKPPIIQVRGLSTAYGQSDHEVPVLREIDLDVQAGSALGIAGESGSGKSTLALALLGAVRAGGTVTAGRVLFDELDVFALNDREQRRMRSQRIGFVPQSPAASLTATMRVADLLAESRTGTRQASRADAERETAALFEELNLPEPGALLARHPYELSGGQQQRLALAIALLNEPDLLILDEPTTGLDASTKRQVIDMIRRIRRQRNLTMVCVSHDLSLLTSICDDLAVMYAGRVIELAPAASHATAARHPYTRALAAAQPRLEQVTLPAGIPGSPPALGSIATGCAFSSRCLHATEECNVLPRRTPSNDHRFVHCHHPQSGSTDEDAVLELSARTVRQDTPMLLEARNIEMSYAAHSTFSSKDRRHHLALDSVTFAVPRGEIVAVVGESGSGKSTLARILAGVESRATGQLTLDGAPLPLQVRARTPHQRQSVQLVLQHPDTALNPRYTVERLLRRCIGLASTNSSSEDQRERVRELLDLVELPAGLIHRLPGQLSGGQKQRVNLACALAASPRLLICDEVTSALDVSVQATILRLLHTIVDRTGVSILLITHDLAAAKLISDSIIVLRNGQIVEHGDTAAVINDPTHSYTAELLESMRF